MHTFIRLFIFNKCCLIVCLGATSEAEGEELALDEMAGAEGASDRQYSLSDFELIRVIGRGSYAKVLMVELKQTKRIYAMKVIKKALVTDDEDIDWVQTEKHVFETASNHPFLVGLHSCFQTPSRLFFVIKFVRGGDLMFHMQRQRRLPEGHARFYAAEISFALNFLHTKGENFAIVSLRCLLNLWNSRYNCENVLSTLLLSLSLRLVFKSTLVERDTVVI